MEDIPQPVSEPYAVGDHVEVYIGSQDADSQYHGITGEIVERHVDDLDKETGRAIDGYSYTIRNIETGEQLSIAFRHSDLVPSDS